MSSVGLLPRMMTWSELQKMPEDGPRIELYDGEVWEMPSATILHQDVCFNTALLFREHARRVGGRMLISPMDVVFSEYNVVQPDVVYFLAARAHLLKAVGRPRDRPDVVVEILSPATESNDRGRKLRMYARYGVPEYWILDTDTQTLEIRSLRGSFYELTVTASGDAVVTSPLLRELSFVVSSLFEEQ